MWLATNHEPAIRGTDEAIWRRIHRINFNFSVPPEKRDFHLAEKLRDEASGILNWCLEGLREWQRSGPKVPDSVSKATEEYRRSQNVVKRFFDECIEAGSRSDYVETGRLYKVFEAWAKTNREFVFKQKKFGSEFGKLAERGRDASGDRIVYFGIRIAGQIKFEEG